MNTKNLMLTAALCVAFASPVFAQSANTNTTPGAVAGQSSGQTPGSGGDNGGKSLGGGGPLAGSTFDETNMNPDAPMGQMDMSMSASFTASEKAEASGRCRVVARN